MALGRRAMRRESTRGAGLGPDGSLGGAMDKRTAGVTASCNGVKKALLSVRELTNGDLLLVVRNAEFLMDIGRKTHRVIEQRYSLHIDPESRRIVIKHSLRIADGRIVTIATFTSESDDIRAWPIFSRLAPDLRPARFDLKEKPSDASVNMGDYDPRLTSLCYSVVAHRHQKIAPSQTIASTSLARLSFREFDISVVARVLDTPSADGALMHHSAQDPMGGAASETMSGQQLIDVMETALGQLTLAGHRPASHGQAVG